MLLDKGQLLNNVLLPDPRFQQKKTHHELRPLTGPKGELQQSLNQRQTVVLGEKSLFCRQKDGREHVH